MDGRGTATALTGGVGLLERAVGYTLASLHLVTQAALSHPTPCRGWDLRALLRHVDDSLGALEEAVDAGHVDLAAAAADVADLDLVPSVRGRACRLAGARAGTRRDHRVSVAGSPTTTGVVTSAGAIEVAVHGWDVARACGRPRPVPPLLAAELLDLCALLVSDADRPSRFAAPVEVSPLAGAGDRLLAFLGRQP